jgi:multimeric flavodoxin WrbA
MKVIAIVGSPRKNGNTEQLASYTLKAVAEEGIDTEIISLASKDIRPCNACMVCRENGECAIQDDLPPIYQKMKEADGIILATPVYFGSCTALLKALMERTGYAARSSGRSILRDKVGGPLVVARRAGHTFTIAQLDLWFHILEIMEPGSTYWNVGFGRQPGEITGDEEGLQTAWNFGKNIARVLKNLKA